MAKPHKRRQPSDPRPLDPTVLEQVSETPPTAPESTTPPAAETPEPKAKTGKGRKARSELYATGKFADSDVITLGSSTKAKVKGSMAEAKFALYGDLSNGQSITVGEVNAKCRGESRATFTNEEGKVINLKPSIRWDWAHKLIAINGEQYVAA